MANPSFVPADRPALDPRSPDTAYVTKDNIVLPIEAQRRGVAVRAQSRQTDANPHTATSGTHGAAPTLAAPANE